MGREPVGDGVKIRSSMSEGELIGGKSRQRISIENEMVGSIWVRLD